MRYRKKNLVKCLIFAIVGISLLFQYSPALSGNKVLPGQTWTNTAPLPSTTPSMEYQQVDKPPVKKLDIPEYDIAGELKNVEIKNYLHGNTKAKMMKFKIALINKGTQKGSRNIPFKIRIINVLDQTLLKEESNSYRTDLRNDYWVLSQMMSVTFTLRHTTAQTQNDLKVILDIDPKNIFNEAQQHRGNNRFVVTW